MWDGISIIPCSKIDTRPWEMRNEESVSSIMIILIAIFFYTNLNKINVDMKMRQNVGIIN